MRAAGTKHFGAPREDVYRALNDPERLARFVPGVERVEIVDEGHWVVRTRIPLGLTSLRIAMQFERAEERPPDHASLRGQGRGLGGSIALETSFDLTEDVAGGTEMRYVLELSLGGAIASLGARVLQPVFQLQVDHVLRALDCELVGS